MVEVLLWFPLQRLDHPEHVHGELGELDLFGRAAHDEDLLEGEGHVLRPFHGRCRQRAEPEERAFWGH